MENNQVSLEKACQQCIKAKRKCTRTLPQCQRCTSKHLTCTYKNQPGSCATTSQFIPDSHAICTNTSRRRRAPPIYDQFSMDYSMWNSQLLDQQYCSNYQTPLSLDHMVLPYPDVVMTMDPMTLLYLKGHLLRLPSTYLQSGGTIFIHPALYRDAPLPPTLRAVHALSALIYRLTPSPYSPCAPQPMSITTINHLINTINRTTSIILNSIANAHTFTTHLSNLQALILLQILTLFRIPTTPPYSPPTLYLPTPPSSPSPPLLPPSILAAATNRQPLLSHLISTLYSSAPSSLPATLSPYKAWLIGESVRRTIHIAHLLLGVESVLRTGSYTLTLFVEALPLDRRGALWDDVWTSTRGRYNSHQKYNYRGSPASAGFGSQDRGKEDVGVDLISYRELTDAWSRGEVEKPSLFEEMLLAACKGIRDVKFRGDPECRFRGHGALNGEVLSERSRYWQ